MLNRSMFLITVLSAVMISSVCAGETRKPLILTTESLEKHVKQFNTDDNELYANTYPNKDAFSFLKANIPLFECPDEDFERTYYFRWWTYRKHIKNTPDGYVITEFLPEVSWSGKYNTICCPPFL